MNKYATLIFAFLYLLNVPLFSQGIPFPEYDAFWKEQLIGFGGVSNRLSGICKDTTINGVDYKQVKSYWLEIGTDSILAPDMNQDIFIRSEGQKVFVKYNTDAEFLLYDFSLEIGDTIVVDIWNFPQQMVVENVQYDNIAGSLRKVIYFEQQPGAPTESWTEGIGSSYGLLNRGSFAIDAEHRLLCFRHMDQSVNFTLIECFFPDAPDDCHFLTGTKDEIENEFNLNIYPNPASELINISAENLNADHLKIELYSYLGNKINIDQKNGGGFFTINISQLNSGIYFIKILNKNNRMVAVHKFIKL